MSTTGFGVNNEGDGFFSEDDEDINALMAHASRGEVLEESDQDFFGMDSTPKRTAPTPRDVAESVAPAPVSEQVAVTAEPEPVEKTEPVQAEQDFAQEEHNESEPAPAAEEQVFVAPADTQPEKAEEPMYQESAPFTPSRPSAPALSETDVARTGRIIKILDAYRDLDADMRFMVAQYIYNSSEVDAEDEAALVVQVLNADPTIKRTMVEFRKAVEQKERLDRVFFLLELPRDVRINLGSLVGTISGERLSGNNRGDNSYVRELEDRIHQLDTSEIDYVIYAQGVMTAGDPVDSK